MNTLHGDSRSRAVRTTGKRRDIGAGHNVQPGKTTRYTRRCKRGCQRANGATTGKASPPPNRQLSEKVSCYHETDLLHAAGSWYGASASIRVGCPTKEAVRRGAPLVPVTADYTEAIRLVTAATYWSIVLRQGNSKQVALQKWRLTAQRILSLSHACA